jgi:hypothetical protein
MNALESELDAVKHYYDRETHQVLAVNEELGFFEEGFDPGSSRFIQIPPLGSNEGFQIMEEFTESIPEGGLKDDLNRALLSRGAFQLFEKALEGHPARLEQWRRFRADRVRMAAQSWLRTHGLAATSKA